ncbi:hypothetical protein JA1_001767 [Spathaspora sp. JA1]|nr:hypothetical protein JA1_001767 [Spathaspora sp. JA1]
MDSFQTYEQKYRSNVERMKNKRLSQQTKSDQNRKIRVPLQNLTSSDINKITKTAIKKVPITTTREMLKKFTQTLPKPIESPLALSARTMQTKFTIMENRGFKEQFLEVDNDIDKASRIIDSEDPMINRCISDMKSIVDWYKTHKVQNWIHKSTTKKVSDSSSIQPIIEDSIISNLKKSVYTTPSLRKSSVVPTHRVVSTSSDEKFIIIARVIDLKSQEQNIVLLLKINSSVELKEGDEINLYNLKVKQSFNGEDLDVYIAWEVFR